MVSSLRVATVWVSSTQAFVKSFGYREEVLTTNAY